MRPKEHVASHGRGHSPLLNNVAWIGVTAGMLILGLAAAACSDEPGGREDMLLAVQQLAVERTAVYPLGSTRIDCIVSDPSRDRFTYTWVSNEGKITGDGPSILWEAPSAYGDYHVMVTVNDGSGNTVNRVATVSVIVREQAKQPFCASCPK
jgi:hypothetical protein